MTRNKDTDYNNDYNNNNNNSNNNYSKFERKMSRLFDDFLNDVGFTRTHSTKYRGDDGKHSTWSPAIDIKEVEREYLVIADVPVSFLILKKIYLYVFSKLLNNFFFFFFFFF
jgi:hypothetical protein